MLLNNEKDSTSIWQFCPRVLHLSSECEGMLGVSLHAVLDTSAKFCNRSSSLEKLDSHMLCIIVSSVSLLCTIPVC